MEIFLYNDLCEKISDYLETHEFMFFFRSSKKIYQNLTHIIPYRKPWLKVTFCVKTPECKELIQELIDNNPKSLDYNSSSGPFAHAILKLGKKATRYKDHRIEIISVPYMFRHFSEEEEHNQSFFEVIQYDKFIRTKLIKYSEKISEISDPIAKSNARIHYFNKLENWEFKINRYQNKYEIYLHKYDQRLAKLIDKN